MSVEERLKARSKCIELLQPLMTLLRAMNKHPSIVMWDGYKYLAIYYDKCTREEYDTIRTFIGDINSTPWTGNVNIDCHGYVNPNPLIITSKSQIKREYLSFSFEIDDRYYYYLGGTDMVLEEIKESNTTIEALEKQLKEEKEKRAQLHIGYCNSVTNHRARAKVINHEFSDENCPTNGYTTFEVEVYDMYTKEIIFRDEFSDYYEMPLIKGDNTTPYCCGKFQLNREVIAWDLYKRNNKGSCQYYKAIVWAIEKYIHDNHLGCHMCE